MKKTSFIFTESMLNMIECIDDAELKLQAYKMICDYGFSGIEPNTTNVVLKVIFSQIKDVIDSNNDKYNKRVENAKFGSMGGRPRKNVEEEIKQDVKELEKELKTLENPKNPMGYSQNPKNPMGFDANPKNPDNVYVNVNDNVNERDKLSLWFFLSQKYPNFKVDVAETELAKTNYSYEKIEQSLKNSVWLQGTTLSFIFTHYNDVINGKYTDFKQPNKSNITVFNYKQREYSKEELNNLYDDLNDVQL